MRISIARRRQALLSSVRALPVALIGGAVALPALGLLSPVQAQQAAPAAPAAPAAAEPASATSAVIEEVTITARDRAEKDQDVPLPISAIGQKRLDEQHVEKWSDIVHRVPSFTPSVTNPRTSANGFAASPAFRAAPTARKATSARSSTMCS